MRVSETHAQSVESGWDVVNAEEEAEAPAFVMLSEARALARNILSGRTFAHGGASPERFLGSARNDNARDVRGGMTMQGTPAAE